MSWIRHGTISTVNGSTVVNGVDSLWSIGISPGASLYLVDGNGNPTAGPYEIASIQSNTRLTLAKPFPGTTGSARAYAISNTVGDQTVSTLANDMTKFYGEISELLDQPQVTPVANSIPVANSSGKISAGWLPDATTTAKGVVQLATTAEAQDGTVANKAVTPATSGSRTTFAVTSTDDATSATAASLKTAGGLAVAKKIIAGDVIQSGRTRILGNRIEGLAIAPNSTFRLRFAAAPMVIAGRLIMSFYGVGGGGADFSLFGHIGQAIYFKPITNQKVTWTGLSVSDVTWVNGGFYVDIGNSLGSTTTMYFNLVATSIFDISWTLEEVI